MPSESEPKVSWNSYPSIVLIGDSLTERGFESDGWVSLLANSLKRKCDVINRGFSGYNTHHIRAIFDEILKDTDIKNTDIAAITIFFGANDAYLPDMVPKQHVPLEEYTDNLRVLVRGSEPTNLINEKTVTN